MTGHEQIAFMECLRQMIFEGTLIGKEGSGIRGARATTALYGMLIGHHGKHIKWLEEDWVDAETLLSDLIADLRHLANDMKIDWAEAEDRADRYYNNEVGDRAKQRSSLQ